LRVPRSLTPRRAISLGKTLIIKGEQINYASFDNVKLTN